MNAGEVAAQLLVNPGFLVAVKDGYVWREVQRITVNNPAVFCLHAEPSCEVAEEGTQSRE